MKFLVSARTQRLGAVGLLVFLGLAAAHPALAQNYPERQGMTPEQACQNDAYRFCQRFIPDHARTGACLRRNKRLLSPECRVFFTARKFRRR